jgi:hypothetical protein
MTAADLLTPAPIKAASLPEVRNHTPYPSQYFQMMDTNDEVFHVLVSRLSYDLNRLDADGVPMLAEQQAPLVDADQFYDQPNTSSCIQESDFAPYKPKCDILLAHATAHAPQGKPHDRWPVGLRIGDWQKHLAVTGPRDLKRGLLGWSVSEPGKALEVPLHWEHAYGGSSQWPQQLRQGQKPEIKAHHSPNPIGSGWADKAWLRKSPASRLDAPQIEVFKQPFGDRQANAMSYPAIGVGPVGRWWSPRKAKAGTYDQAWKETRWPKLPKDFDFGYWNCAPEDQQIDYPKGGEEIVLLGFRPQEKEPMHCVLPPPHLHAVLRLHIGIIVGLPMRLDTLIFDLKDWTLSCVYRLQVAAKAQVRVLELRTGRAPA